MNRRTAAKLLGVVPLLAATGTALEAQRQGKEMALHPKIADAIRAIEAAEAYMRGAAHDFGGHRVAALAATERAREQLKLCLAYRAVRGG